MALETTLAQVNPAATTLTDAYTVPAGKRAAAYVIVANRTSTAATYRISLAIAGAADSNEQYVVYDSSVSTIPQATRRLALAAGDVVRVYASAANLSFSVNGIEQDV